LKSVCLVFYLNSSNLACDALGLGWRRKQLARRSNGGMTDTGRTSHSRRWLRETGEFSKRTTTSSLKVVGSQRRCVIGPRHVFRRTSWMLYWRLDIR